MTTTIMVVEENLDTLVPLSPDEDTVLSKNTKHSHQHQCAENLFRFSVELSSLCPPHETSTVYPFSAASA